MTEGINPFKLPAATNLIIVAAVVIIGAVFRKGHAETGHWITVGGLGYYLILTLWPAIKMIRRFPTVPPRGKAHALVVVVMLYLFIKAFFVEDITYFVILVLLAIEYLLADPVKSD